MTNTDTDAGDAETPTPQISILAQFIRDLSFENVSAQRGAAPQGKPDISVAVSTEARRLDEGRYEVTLKINAKAKSDDDVIFIVELDYVGLFSLIQIPNEGLHPVLLIECPHLIFPFARRIIADTTRDGGFPPLMLDPIDFAALYRQQLQAAEAPASSEVLSQS